MKIVAVILVLTGLVWTFQGLGVVGGSFMTGQTRWLTIGIAVAVVGAALFLFDLWRTSVRIRGRNDRQ